MSLSIATRLRRAAAQTPSPLPSGARQTQASGGVERPTVSRLGTSSPAYSGNPPALTAIATPGLTVGSRSRIQTKQARAERGNSLQRRHSIAVAFVGDIAMKHGILVKNLCQALDTAPLCFVRHPLSHTSTDNVRWAEKLLDVRLVQITTHHFTKKTCV